MISFKTEVQKSKAACTKDKETASDLKQHSRKNLPDSIPPIDKDDLKGKLAIYDASHNQGHSSVIRVITFNVKLELNLDSRSTLTQGILNSKIAY